MKVWLNGEIIDAERATLPVTDRGVLYGDALFETFRTYDGVPFKLDEHLRRLADSGEFFNLNVPIEADGLRDAVTALLAANRMTDAAVRLTVTRGAVSGPLGLIDSGCPNAFMTLRQITYPPELYERGMKLITSTVRRNSFSPLSRHKTANYLDALLARREAQAAGADEALMLDEIGNVAECTTANIFAVVNDVVMTPLLDGPILPGVTRATALEICRGLSMRTSEEPFAPEVLHKADEVFITNSVLELMPVTTLDGKTIGAGGPSGPGPTYLRLHKAYRELVRN